MYFSARDFEGAVALRLRCCLRLRFRLRLSFCLRLIFRLRLRWCLLRRLRCAERASYVVQ